MRIKATSITFHVSRQRRRNSTGGHPSGLGSNPDSVAGDLCESSPSFSEPLRRCVTPPVTAGFYRPCLSGLQGRFSKSGYQALQHSSHSVKVASFLPPNEETELIPSSFPKREEKRAEPHQRASALVERPTPQLRVSRNNSCLHPKQLSGQAPDIHLRLGHGNVY